MKRIYTFIIALFIVANSFGQGFTLNPRMAKGQGPNNNLLIEAFSDFKNTSTDVADSLFTWKILNITMPTGWEYGMCDPNNCLTNIQVGDSGVFLLTIGLQSTFRGDFVPNGISGIGNATVLVSSKKYPEYFDTLKFEMSAWPTGINGLNASREFKFYPNPAKDRISFNYAGNKGLAIEIYNILGNVIKTVYLQSTEANVNISDMQRGIYFIRFTENGKITTKSFSKID